MKKTNILLSLFAAAMLLSVGCREKQEIADDIVIPGLGGTEEIANELDNWLYENFTKPYNIDVVYRWDAAQMYSSLSGSKLVPVKYDVVKPMMAALRDVWFEPYIQASGSADFLKKMAPKKVVLVGSPEYEQGAIKLGQAEGGRKILLLNANGFDASNVDGLKSALNTIEHEFAHILHQTILFDQEFQQISAGLYDSSGWRYVEPEDAYAQGFVSPYAMSGKDEDFVETVSRILVYGYDWFEQTVLAAAAASTVNTGAQDALLRKVDVVQEYLLDSWGVRFLDDPVTGEKGLHSYVQAAIEEVSANPPME